MLSSYSGGSHGRSATHLPQEETEFMKKSIFRRGISFGLTLATLLSFSLTARAAQQHTTTDFQLVEIQGTDVVMEEGPFPYTGQPIEPKVTVTVNDTVLTEGTDYSVTYINNLAPGTGTLTVRGIATASETLGYFGKVSMDFTIVKELTPEMPTEPETPTQPEEPTVPENSTEPTQPETPSDPSAPTRPEEETKPEETTPADYKITSGSGSKWNQKSGKDLTFTVNADTSGVTEIRINGKKLDAAHYTLGKDGKITLKNSWLEKQLIGSYRIGVVFADGSTEGTFSVLAQVDPTNPQTGDTIGLWIGMMSVSAVLAVGIWLLRKARK